MFGVGWPEMLGAAVLLGLLVLWLAVRTGSS